MGKLFDIRTRFGAFLTTFLFFAMVFLAAFSSSAITSYHLMQVKGAEPPELDEPLRSSYGEHAGPRSYRDALPDRSKAVYDAIEEGFRTFDRDIILPEGTTEGEVISCYESVLYDNPDIFWTDVEYHISCQFKQVLMLTPTYSMEAADAKARLDSYDAVAEKVAARLPGSWTAAVKASEICRYVAYLAEYAHADERAASCQGIDSVFDGGVSVCAGYSRAVQFICYHAGIDCRYVSGTAYSSKTDGPHAWNAVLDDTGMTFYYDATWADNGRNGFEERWCMVPLEEFSGHFPSYATILPDYI